MDIKKDYLRIKLEAFEGPIDLLYKLIEKNKIDIYDIPIAQLADQYIDYINTFSKNLESISEFIWFAASLIEIKSRMLLPKKIVSEFEKEDPREELVKKLVEYKMFKNISETLKRHAELSSKALYKCPDHETLNIVSDNHQLDLDGILENITLKQLFSVFNDLMKRKETMPDEIQFDHISRDIFTVEDKISYIQELLKKDRIISFKDTFKDTALKSEKIVTFIALLELIKTRIIKITQTNIFGEIIITAN